MAEFRILPGKKRRKMGIVLALKLNGQKRLKGQADVILTPHPQFLLPIEGRRRKLADSTRNLDGKG
jgi:hypothetical protein